MQQTDEAANATIKAIFDRVDITLNSTQTEEVLDIIAFNENNPSIISVFIWCMFLTVFCVFLWCFFRTNQSDRFASSFTMSDSNNNSTSIQPNHKDGQRGRESAFDLLNETISESYEKE